MTFTLPLINQSLCYLDSASLPQTSGTPGEDKTENLTHQFCGDWCHGLHPSKALSSWVTTPPCPPFHPLGWLRQPQLQATHAGLFVPDKVQRSQRVPDKIPRNCGPWYCCMPSSSLSKITLIPEGPCSQLENWGFSLRGQSHQSIQVVRVMNNRVGGGR